jgi:hypothetical protein
MKTATLHYIMGRLARRRGEALELSRFWTDAECEDYKRGWNSLD